MAVLPLLSAASSDYRVDSICAVTFSLSLSHRHFPESVIVGLHTINRARQTIAVCLALNFFMKPYPSAVPFLLFSSFRQQDAHQNTQESRDHPAKPMEAKGTASKSGIGTPRSFSAKRTLHTPVTATGNRIGAAMLRQPLLKEGERNEHNGHRVDRPQHWNGYPKDKVQPGICDRHAYHRKHRGPSPIRESGPEQGKILAARADEPHTDIEASNDKNRRQQ